MAAACASVRCECRSPPIGLAAISPSARNLACQRIALALATPNRFAACPHEAPVSMTAITGSRTSSDKARAIMPYVDRTPWNHSGNLPATLSRLSSKGSGSSAMKKIIRRAAQRQGLNQNRAADRPAQRDQADELGIRGRRQQARAPDRAQRHRVGGKAKQLFHCSTNSGCTVIIGAIATRALGTIACGKTPRQAAFSPERHA